MVGMKFIVSVRAMHHLLEMKTFPEAAREKRRTNQTIKKRKKYNEARDISHPPSNVPRVWNLLVFFLLVLFHSFFL